MKEVIIDNIDLDTLLVITTQNIGISVVIIQE